MQYFLWTVASIAAYIGGLIVVIRVTPMLLLRSFDEGLFMGIAAADIMGALLAFGAVTISYIIFNGNFAIKVLDFFFLAGILIVATRIALSILRPHHVVGTFQVSRFAAAGFCLFLAAAALFYIVLLFIPGR